MGKGEFQSGNSMQNYSFKPLNIKIENLNVRSDRSKRFEINQTTCKLKIKNEQKENISISPDSQVPSIHKPIILRSETDLNLFNRFHLKYLKIRLENNLNTVINQHIK